MRKATLSKPTSTLLTEQAMSDRTPSKAFRFLDLPPELKNAIYSCYLEDASPYGIDILATRACLPDPAITAVCRRVRHEALGLHKEAVKTFCANHNFEVSFDTTTTDDNTELQIMRVMREHSKLPFKSDIARFTFMFFGGQTYFLSLRIECDAGEDGAVTHRAMLGPCTLSNDETARLQELFAELLSVRVQQERLKLATTPIEIAHTRLSRKLSFACYMAAVFGED